MAQESASQDHNELETAARRASRAKIEEGVALYELGNLYWAGFGPEHVPVQKDDAVLAANFPDLTVNVQAPAFIWPETVQSGFRNGTASPTNEETFNHFVRQIAERHSWISVHTPGFTSRDGQSFAYIILSKSSDVLNNGFRNSTRLRIWLQSGVHGNEPAGDQALLALLGKLDSSLDWASSILDKVDIILFPRYNPDGISVFGRCGGGRLDPNRDHIRLGVPQTKGIRKLFCDFAPHIAVDMHEYSARARIGQYVHGSDVMFSAAKNLNIHQDIRDLSEGLFVDNIRRKLGDAQLRHEPYVPTNGVKISFNEAGTNGKVGRNALGLTQCISFLCEIRGIGIADQHFQRRTAAGLTFLEGVLETVIGNFERVYNTVNTAVNAFIDSSNDIVVKDAPKVTDRTFTLIDRKTGQIVQLPICFSSMTPTIPVLTRPRPAAYLILSSRSDIAAHLADLGLDVQRLDKNWTGLVEKYTIDTAILQESHDEGIVPTRVTTSITQVEMCFPHETFLISTRQRNAALAFIALEPENLDSLVSLGIISVITGDEYPVYRKMTQSDSRS